jgi:hypothetical protein
MRMSLRRRVCLRFGLHMRGLHLLRQLESLLMSDEELGFAAINRAAASR